MTWTVLEGDARIELPTLAAKSVQCVVTSPPYWGLRDYGVDGQLGLESTPEEYVANLVAVFREVRRVLRKDGTVWLNLGDSYVSGQGGRQSAIGELPPVIRRDRPEPKPRPELDNAPSGWAERAVTPRTYPGRDSGLKPKDLYGMPWRVAFALQQPYVRHAIEAEAWRGWMAGLVDGEGCYSCVAVPPTTGVNESHSTRLQIRMADTEAVEHVVAITGMNSITYDQLPPSMVDAGQRAAQQWKVSGDKMADLTADIFPFLTVKRRQAIVAWNLQALKVPTKRGQPIPAENMAKRRLLYNVLHDLNQRRPVDLPSWCVLPKAYSEPGWYLRSDCIWAKPNPMPESVTDRPTKAHEYVFLLSKNARYFYDADAVREEAIKGASGSTFMNGKTGINGLGRVSRAERIESAYRNLRSVWNIATEPFPEAHFATFPKKLVEPCIKAGTSEKGCCPECAAPYRRMVEADRVVLTGSGGLSLAAAHGPDGQVAERARLETRTVGWERSCSNLHGLDTVPCTVLDPFCGAGTSGVVALRLGRSFVGIELNPEYVEMARRRIENDAPLFNRIEATP